MNGIGSDSRTVAQASGKQRAPWYRFVPFILFMALFALCSAVLQDMGVGKEFAEKFFEESENIKAWSWLFSGLLTALGSLIASAVGFAFKFRIAPHRGIGRLAQSIAEKNLDVDQVGDLITVLERYRGNPERAVDAFRLMADTQKSSPKAADEAIEIFKLVTKLRTSTEDADENAMREDAHVGTSNIMPYIRVIGAAAVGSQLQAHYLKQLKLLKERIQALSEGRKRDLESKLDQFRLAETIANYYISKARKDPADASLVCVYATSLDRPSEFKNGYGLGYFNTLAKLNSAMKHVDKLEANERGMLPDRVFRQFGKRTGTTQLVSEREHFDGIVTECVGEIRAYATSDDWLRDADRDVWLGARSARVCILTRAQFREEISISAAGNISAGLADYIIWHWTSRALVHFIILEDFVQASHDPKEEPATQIRGTKACASDESLWKEYATKLKRGTYEQFEEDGIDDFIVYNDETVFGRTEAQPKPEQVPVRIITRDNKDQRNMPESYRQFFFSAWKESLTPAELLSQIEHSDPTDTDLHNNCKKVADQILRRYQRDICDGAEA